MMVSSFDGRKAFWVLSRASFAGIARLGIAQNFPLLVRATAFNIEWCRATKLSLFRPSLFGNTNWRYSKRKHDHLPFLLPCLFVMVTNGFSFHRSPYRSWRRLSWTECDLKIYDYEDDDGEFLWIKEGLSRGLHLRALHGLVSHKIFHYLCEQLHSILNDAVQQNYPYFARLCLVIQIGGIVRGNMTIYHFFFHVCSWW